jgi:myosin heavy subunit
LNKKFKKKTKNRQSEQKRDILKQLEQEVSDLKRKETDTQKMIKIKKENEKQCEKLRQEIQHIKQERVKLIKQIKQETDSFRKYKQVKEKEFNNLKALDCKRMVEITKLHEGNNRQEAILRRKNEEISRIRKQLRETLEKQKIVETAVELAKLQKELNKFDELMPPSQQPFKRKFNEIMTPPQRPPKRKFVTDTTYIAGSSAGSSSSNCLKDDENQLNRLQLEQRIERITLELNLVFLKLQEIFCLDIDGLLILDLTMSSICPHSGSLTRTSPGVDISSVHDDKLPHDIEMKSVQINEIQQMVIEGDQNDRAKHLFNNIHGLLDAKVLIEHLYSSGVQYLIDCKLKQTQFESNTTGMFKRIVLIVLILILF